MTARAINDPSALGWEYDSETGRWSWGGGQCDCPGGGGGDGGGGGMWPLPPKPSVDLLACRNSTVRGLDLLEVAEDGSLSKYGHCSVTAASSNIHEFCPTAPLVAVAVSGYTDVWIFDYSTPSCEQVATFRLSFNIASFAWSPSGKYLFFTEYNNRKATVWENSDSGWKEYSPVSRIVEDITDEQFEAMGITDPEEREARQLDAKTLSVIGFGANLDPSFDTRFIVATDTLGPIQLVNATPTGCVNVDKDYGLWGYIGVDYRSGAPTKLVGHPQSNAFFYIGPGTEQAGGGVFHHLGSGWANPELISVSRKAETWVSYAADAYNGTFAELPQFLTVSPSGNYLVSARWKSTSVTSIFKLNQSCMPERIGDMPKQASGKTQFVNWSADEKFFYVWSETKVHSYEWNDGSPVYIGVAYDGVATPQHFNGGTNSWVQAGANTYMNRSKF